VSQFQLDKVSRQLVGVHEGPTKNLGSSRWSTERRLLT
jgi:hypothetical protein